MKKTLEVCKHLALLAGEAIMEIYETDFGVVQKEDSSPLTQADMRANKIIVEGLKKEFPHYAILSEEEKDSADRLENDWCFIVDPLDGTKQFIKKDGQFTVNIALSYQGKVVVGVVYAPALNELYYAAKGLGSFLDTANSLEIPLQVSHKLNELTIVMSELHRSEKEEELLEAQSTKISQVISCGSSLKGCMVAAGKADVYYRYGLTCEWDVAAMQCVVEQAGGLFMQLDATPMTYNRKNVLNEKGFLAVNRQENVWV